MTTITTSKTKLRIAVDIDGTIDVTKHLWELIKDHEVYFVTTRAKSKEERRKQLRALGITGYKDIIIVEGSRHDWIAHNKAMWIKENNIDVFFDNNSLNTGYTKTEMPSVECYLVV